MVCLFDGDRLRKIAREVNVETFTNSQPVRDQLQGDDIEQALQAIDGLGKFDLFGLSGRELLVVVVADDNWPASTSND